MENNRECIQWKTKCEELASWYLQNKYSGNLLPSAREAGLIICLELALLLTRGSELSPMTVARELLSNGSRRNTMRRIDFSELSLE
jgi:hypothetical protein